MKLVMEIKSEATRTLAAQEGEATIDADVLLTMSILIDPTRSSCSLIDFLYQCKPTSPSPTVTVMWTSVEEGFINPSVRNIVISAKTARELIQRMEVLTRNIVKAGMQKSAMQIFSCLLFDKEKYFSFFSSCDAICTIDSFHCVCKPPKSIEDMMHKNCVEEDPLVFV